MAQDGPKLNFTGLNSGLAARWQAGVPDADSHPPERHVTTAGTGPCRHCLGEIAGRETYLILAHRPFPKPQPSAEVGPIFLCAAPLDTLVLRVRPRRMGTGHGNPMRLRQLSGQLDRPAALHA